MKMTVTHKWPADVRFDGQPIPPREDHCVFEESGWESVRQMQAQLLRRWRKAHPEIRKIENGIEYQDRYFVQSVTLE